MSQLFDILIYAVVNACDMYACFSMHLCVPIYSVSLSASKKIPVLKSAFFNLRPQEVHLSAFKELIDFSVQPCFSIFFTFFFYIYSMTLFVFYLAIDKSYIKSDFDAEEKNLWQWSLMRQPAD